MANFGTLPRFVRPCLCQTIQLMYFWYQKASHPDLKLFPLPLLFMFLLSHVVEALLFVRFHILQGLFLLGVISKPSITPKWIGQLLMLQPSTFCNLAEFKLDDQRARKALG